MALVNALHDGTGWNLHFPDGEKEILAGPFGSSIEARDEALKLGFDVCTVMPRTLRSLRPSGALFKYDDKWWRISSVQGDTALSKSVDGSYEMKFSIDLEVVPSILETK